MNKIKLRKAITLLESVTGKKVVLKENEISVKQQKVIDFFNKLRTVENVLNWSKNNPEKFDELFRQDLIQAGSGDFERWLQRNTSVELSPETLSPENAADLWYNEVYTKKSNFIKNLEDFAVKHKNDIVTNIEFEHSDPVFGKYMSLLELD